MNKLVIDSYLSELNSNIFFAHYQHTSLIDSPTGTGKTSMIFERALTQEKVVVAFPYTSQVIQQSKKHPGFQCLHDDAEYDETQSSRIICTYDKLVKMINHDVAKDVQEKSKSFSMCLVFEMPCQFRVQDVSKWIWSNFLM